MGALGGVLGTPLANSAAEMWETLKTDTLGCPLVLGGSPKRSLGGTPGGTHGYPKAGEWLRNRAFSRDGRITHEHFLI